MRFANEEEERAWEARQKKNCERFARFVGAEPSDIIALAERIERSKKLRGGK